jgi:multiple sugar transport system permease protein
MPGVRERKPFNLVMKILLLFLALIFFLFPLYWMFTMAFKPEIDWTALPAKLIPNPLTLDNFYTGLFRMKGLSGIMDSTIIAVSNTAISMLLGTLAGYGLSRFQFRQNLAFFILSQRIAPPITFTIPFFLLFGVVLPFNLLDTHIAVIIVHLTFNLPFATWMMKTFFDGIPKELDESAMVDGCSPTRAFMGIILPVSLGGIIATAVMCFMFSWNEFLIQLFLTRSAVTPLPTLIPKFYGGHDILYGVVSAVALFAVIPPILIVAFLQKYLVRGFTMGFLKG